jgi:hypothetical protein
MMFGTWYSFIGVCALLLLITVIRYRVRHQITMLVRNTHFDWCTYCVPAMVASANWPRRTPEIEGQMRANLAWLRFFGVAGQLDSRCVQDIDNFGVQNSFCC